MTQDPRIPTAPRSPWQLLYGACHTVRWRWYAGRAARLPRPVISVGNLHWGGTGKTPLVAALAAHLRDRNLRPAVLSRGYRRRGKGLLVVSTGDGPLIGPLVAGDEPVLLAGELDGVAVVVGRDRFAAGLHALKRLEPAPQVFVLDDGFSHLRLFRDIDLVVVPEQDPYGGGRLLPGGRLREPLAAMGRADALLASGGDRQFARIIAESLRPFGFQGPGFSCAVRTRPARLLSGETLPTGSRVVAVAAIARPQRFLESVRGLGFEVAATLFLPDHHRYPPRTLRRIERLWRTSGADAVLTTSKDRVKLLGRSDVPLAELPIRAAPGAEFWSWLDGRLQLQLAEHAAAADRKRD